MAAKTNKEEVDKWIDGAKECHRVWHKFSSYITRTFGNDLYGEWEEIILGDKKTRYRPFNEVEFSKRLTGYEVMRKIEKWCKRHCPQIQILNCDDSVYAGSTILLIPHPAHGITIMYIPQCTQIQNQLFLYKGHHQRLVKALQKMGKEVYTKESW